MAAERAGNATAALTAWREALALLPTSSRQHETVLGRVADLSRCLDSGAPAAPRPSWARRAGPLGVLALLLWKAKAIVLFFASKAKLLLLGLGQGGTVLSALVSLGVYWAAWGWAFAAGLIVSLYVHEMGHVAALARFGIKATAPMFIPGLGAVVRLKQYPASPREDARVGLAGPTWGLAAAAACYAAFLALQAPMLAAVAVWGARINLFNLIPLGPLDGGRGFRALTRGQRWLVVAVLAVLLVVTGEGLLWLVLAAAALRALAGEPAREADWPACWQFSLLLLALSVLGAAPVPIPVTP
jgi:Zn-dependent protease